MQEAGAEYISGEALCQRLGVSRTAVWKIIGKLKEDGYEIEGVSNRGYRLKQLPDVLTREACLSLFRGTWACSQVEYYPVIGSTNDRAKEAAGEGAPHGTLILADCQNAGKGRRGRQWSTPAGTCIAMSSMLRPEFPPEKASMLTLVMALSVSRAIQELSELETGIKWPNDIVVRGRKLCGILTEMSADMDQIHYVVIGTGINVNQEAFPKELSKTATSLLIETGHPMNRAKIVARCMECFEADYETFASDGSMRGLKADYEARLVNLGRKVQVLAGPNGFTGVARGVDESGCLLVEKEDGAMVPVMSGEVSVRGIYGYV